MSDRAFNDVLVGLGMALVAISALSWGLWKAIRWARRASRAHRGGVVALKGPFPKRREGLLGCGHVGPADHGLCFECERQRALKALR